MSKKLLNAYRVELSTTRRLLAGLSLAVLAGCASQDSASAGMANPASVYCGELGGQVEIMQTSSGQVGICLLPNGVKIEEWTLYRRDHPELKS